MTEKSDPPPEQIAERVLADIAAMRRADTFAMRDIEALARAVKTLGLRTKGTVEVCAKCRCELNTLNVRWCIDRNSKNAPDACPLRTPAQAKEK